MTRLETGHARHILPRFLPDGRHFLFYAEGTPEARGVYVGELDRTEIRRLRDADSGAEFASTGHLLFVSQGTLFAQKFDPDRLALSGDAFPVAQQVAVTTGGVGLSASEAGPIAYRRGAASAPRQLVWVDRSGDEIGRIGGPDAARPVNPALSPDGRSLAVNRFENQNNDIFLIDTATGRRVRFTTDTGNDFNPIWSPDGEYIAYNGGTGFDVMVQPLNGSQARVQPLFTSSGGEFPLDWSLDGRFLLYSIRNPETKADLWVVPMNRSRKAGEPVGIARTAADERDGQFSPDAKWIAYQSDESGQFEIYIKPFPDRGGRPEQISTNGGTEVRWRRDGKELFYIAPDRRLMAALITAQNVVNPTL